MKPREKRKNYDIPCKARRKAKRALDRAMSASSEASAGMVEADHTSTAVSSFDMMATSDPTPLHSAEMVDNATSSAAVTLTAASPSPTPCNITAAVMADSDPTKISSANVVETSQLPSAEMVDAIPIESSVTIDKTPELAEKVETSSLLPSSTEKVASTSQVTKRTASSSLEDALRERERQDRYELDEIKSFRSLIKYFTEQDYNPDKLLLIYKELDAVYESRIKRLSTPL